MGFLSIIIKLFKFGREIFGKKSEICSSHGGVGVEDEFIEVQNGGVNGGEADGFGCFIVCG